MAIGNDLKYGNDIYEALSKNQVPRKIAHIIPNFDDLEESNTEIDEKDEKDEENNHLNDDNLNISSF